MKQIRTIGLLVGLTLLSATGCVNIFERLSSFTGGYSGGTRAVVNPKNFVSLIDNPYLPLRPGTTYIYEGKMAEGFERETFEVTQETRVILGVTCVVVRDSVYQDGKLVERTDDWFAQDREGNVWYFGEDSKDYDNGKLVSTKGSWEAGVKGARAGIIMKANPNPGDTYRQEYFRGEAEDWATVLSLDGRARIPLGSYQNLLSTKEWSALDKPPKYEEKFYARGIGHIMTRHVTGGHVLQLVKINRS
ncbi:MAG: hypothetical protein KJ558_01350 [Gammaproteobacteria bacterium]|nr:hypothetical protein [Gammaproteobacteria bacterium]MBU1653482.1 hypothetical protein [Gammaproteobacteria bacterium]MBU1962723.1 hypothetical protein [Gammaproteobacteria bacterium]